VHSASSGEALNVGILFIFPEQKKVVFHALLNFQAIACLSKLSEWLVKAHKKALSKKPKR
jgi:hypothetical protein